MYANYVWPNSTWRAQYVTLEIARVMDNECIDILLMQEPYNLSGKFIGLGRRLQIRHRDHGPNSNTKPDDHDD